MEPKFQTSFIPKKPLTQSAPSSQTKSSGAPSLIFVIGIFAFIISILVAGGAFGWRYYLIQREKQLSKNFDALNQQFKPELISILKQTDMKISMAKSLLDNHISMSGLFNFISRMTSEDVRFTSLSVSAPLDRSQGITIRMTGYTRNYESLAYQSDQFSFLQDYALQDIVINPVVSGPKQNEDGTVSFEFSAKINPKSLLYKENFQVDTNSTSSDTNTP